MSDVMDLVRTCPYCHAAVELKHSSAVYRNGKDYGMMYVCARYPECNSYVGCHPNSTVPLGMLASDELRRERMRAHAAFDRIWRSGRMSRTKAYRWLRGKMSMQKHEAHIGRMNSMQCAHVVALAEQYLAEQGSRA